MTDAITIVEGLDFVVSLAEGHVHPEDLDAARRAADDARLRVGHIGSAMVLAFVGGTGSGKSSLINALVADEVAPTSPVRPHTAEPLAVIPALPDEPLRGLLDALGVAHVETQDRLPEFALLDMTDIDSVTLEHRQRVEQLMPAVDLILWVLDPVKYADRAVHRELIAPLADAADRLIFVLNRIDEVSGDALDQVIGHLESLLESDGIADPVVFATAAAPPDSPPLGIDALLAHLIDRFHEKRVHRAKIVDDARRAARAIAGSAGVSGGGSLDFERRWAAVRAEIAAVGNRSSGAAAFEEVLSLLEGFVLDISIDAGGAFGIRIRQSFGASLMETELKAAFAAAGEDRETTIDDELQRRFGAPLRELLWQRASLAAVYAGMAVDASSADRSLGRV